LLITGSNLSQASPLGGLSPPHDAFQGHAAHPPRRFGALNPKGSSGTCIPEGDIAIFICRFHGAQYETTNRLAWPPGSSAHRCRHRSNRPGPATPLATCRCAGRPCGPAAMVVSMPCRSRLLEVCRWPYARAAPSCTSSRATPQSKTRRPASRAHRACRRGVCYNLARRSSLTQGDPR
jgi:hypothetical protein